MSRLSEKQIAAIEYLSLPGKGGLTDEQIAEKVGVSARTIYRWKKDDRFYNELKRNIVRNTTDKLPDMLDSAIEHAIKDGSAAMFRTLMQTHGLLTDKVEVETKNDGAVDADAIKARLAEWTTDRAD